MIGPDHFDSDECTCSCHENPESIVHNVACCSPCLICEKNIERGAVESHASKHRKEAEKAANLELEAQVLFPLAPLS